MDKDRLSSPDTERSILGAILLNNQHFYEDCVDLRVDDLSLESHRRIYAVMNEVLNGMVEGITEIDLRTLVEVLDQRKQLQGIGGVAYIVSLTEGVARRANIREYVAIVREKSRLRGVVRICDRHKHRAFDAQESANAILADLQGDLLAEAAENASPPKRIGDITSRVRERMERRRKIAEDRVAVEFTWGLSGLDAFTKGMFRGEMTVIGGESGAYKTALMAQVILANAMESRNCAIFSIEMPEEQMTERLFPPMQDVITATHLRDPRLMNEHTHMKAWDRIEKRLNSLPIWIDDGKADIKHLIARMRMMKRKYKIDIFAVDYLQLIESAAKTMAEKTTENIFALRDFVKAEKDCHLLVLSQYSKPKGFRGKKMTRNRDDLSGAGAIHHAAHNVLLINVESAKEKPSNALLEAIVDIDKQRNGLIGRHECMLDRDWLRFTYPQPANTQGTLGGMK